MAEQRWNAFRSEIVQEERVRLLRDRPAREETGPVVYWMQRSQRASDNHALEYAVEQANNRNAELYVAFGLMDGYPEANARHYRFLLEGLEACAASLASRGIPFLPVRGHPAEVAVAASEQASLLVCDAGYLWHLRQWRKRVVDEAACPVVLVETDLIVPVAEASTKREYAARTIRKKIMTRLDHFLELPPPQALERRGAGGESRGATGGAAGGADGASDSGAPAGPALMPTFEPVDLGDLEATLTSLSVDRSIAPVPALFRGGEAEARSRFRRFLQHTLPAYSAHRNQPQTDDTSHMSPYLHFGHVSPLRLVLDARQAAGADQSEQLADFVEELAVRRELAFNYCYFEPRYASFQALPDWARQTLDEHRRDERPYLYSPEQLEQARTHDPYWNAAMQEMRYTGYMHNYMRMYWGKKILEWSLTPEEGFETALRLNNRYFLDGRDPASYANVGWIFGLHDRPWTERSVFGKVRIMTAAGLERKCRIQAYVEKVEARVAELSNG
jgi:deoxyribodipyrimidine photo-lyase